MKRILTALVLIPLVLALVFLGPRWLFALATAGVAALASWEYMAMTDLSGAKPPRIAVLVAVVLLFVGHFEFPDLTIALFSALALGLLIYCTFTSPIDRVMADVSCAVFCLVYTGLSLVAVTALRDEGNGPSLVAFLFCAVWAGDIAALYVGRTWGKHKLAPSISPNKSWEGAAASVAGSMLAAGALLALAAYLESWNSAKLTFGEDLWYWLVLAAVLNVAAQVGDLAESALKRSVGVKDSGNLLPGHGGILDRIDALLVAAPVLWYAQLLHQRF